MPVRQVGAALGDLGIVGHSTAEGDSQARGWSVGGALRGSAGGGERRALTVRGATGEALPMIEGYELFCPYRKALGPSLIA